MLKIQKYTLLIAGLSLAFLILAVADAGTAKVEFSTTQTSGIPAPDDSSGYLSGADEVCEDEQMHQITSNCFFAEEFNLITLHKNSDLIFQPFLIPWEPPKV
ncbi:MAG TPA: hypothetical protein DER09_05190 [Prolixibacteraceae bacterium]|nr:hypothetical protein [Prolixibacteraceae bacterium]